jgi:hypothetical protein
MKNNSYTLIAKIKEKGSNETKHVKYHSPDLINFQRFLDNNFDDWYYFNVYDDSKQQIGNFTKNKRCVSKRI